MTLPPDASSPPFVSLRQLGKCYGAGPPILEGIDLNVAEGDFISFLGPSGCGKSTLLKLLAGLSQPTAGRLRIAGRPPAEARDACFMVFQEARLLPWLRVQHNVELPLRLRGIERAERARRASAMLELVGLAADRDKFPWQLSGGMAMRVAIARALALAPRLLLLDEPFGALDELTRHQLDEALLRFREHDPFTAFFVTHSVAEAVFLSSRIVVLSAAPGRVANVIEVPFAFPRSAKLRESEAFLGLLAQATHALRLAATASAA